MRLASMRRTSGVPCPIVAADLLSRATMIRQITGRIVLSCRDRSD
jgi:hypothetical protein